MHIISSLCGISLGDEEAIVRASAVRALAIFVLFPSLKEGKILHTNKIEENAPLELTKYQFQIFVTLKIQPKLFLN